MVALRWEGGSLDLSLVKSFVEPLGLPKVTRHTDSLWEKFPKWSGDPHIEKMVTYCGADFSA